MNIKNKLYLIALAILIMAFQSFNPYPFEFVIAAITLIAAGIILEKNKPQKSL